MAKREGGPDENVLRSRYGSLDSASFIYRILGWAVIVGGIFVSVGGGLAAMASGDDGGASVAAGIAIFALGSLGSLIVGVFLLAFADLLRLLIDLEWNTRLTAWNLAVDDE
ncbi:MAG: hypothetical protein WEE64_12890 [Dehalococcoidia bacterium]